MWFRKSKRDSSTDMAVVIFGPPKIRGFGPFNNGCGGSYLASKLVYPMIFKSSSLDFWIPGHQKLTWEHFQSKWSIFALKITLFVKRPRSRFGVRGVNKLGLGAKSVILKNRVPLTQWGWNCRFLLVLTQMIFENFFRNFGGGWCQGWMIWAGMSHHPPVWLNIVM